ncbi:EutD and phosphobutyryltransferase) (Pta) (PDB:1QZT) (PUBMED:28754323) [Commensalibacter communis]|uniref:EutD and phosphobutyryltransferase (Pta (PDB:1QZT (PUBMED:28754323 n=1 Tax=Commensalibacter communis TaxID=2972786 RepID=A0A9W4TR52_9PROT|nr:bifunctional enoyl-CoA hydratase/phosphate acetyltransferase [Commensalibacter communis]CAI3949239.1 EutD and phosphobutyryltransferase) (Pta) (PDB:1QZT) (PUBMED:28754323) [Commensalibacter communis]CAI3950648.1 EutD and phosphobutyryltransferase) (Pta) (PDB:1QZT) (PUBMED:28754323) [Commensalibacter communis]CAI3952362.1 EutD and phosphobutyryltransferase) (Pta) (PDB:1QZT) (PUBMED:28754323) [Commensalibacter communis]CAI3953489.1 EutD and phosphobutyryltransferase) (Pta) (PDB:1QZT) (PUBMED:2
MFAHHQKLIEKAKEKEAPKCAVCYPCEHTAIESGIEAHKLGLLNPIFVGPADEIKAIAAKHNISLDGYEIIDAKSEAAAATNSVQLIREGKAQLLMKGSLHTDVMLKAVVNKENGLRTGKRITHAFLMDGLNWETPYIISDAAINIAPDLTTKMHIIQNAIDLHHALGYGVPRVAILSAVEMVNPDIPSTLEAAALCKMADRGQITNGILDGPLALDNAVSLKAAQMKKLDTPVTGKAQILIPPDLISGNILFKALCFIGDQPSHADSAGIVLGAKAPIILTSRASGLDSRLVSCAMAKLSYYHSV